MTSRPCLRPWVRCPWEIESASRLLRIGSGLCKTLDHLRWQVGPGQIIRIGPFLTATATAAAAASIPPLGIDGLHSSSSPRVDQPGLQLTHARVPRARQRGQSTATDESGGDDRSLSPTSEEERLQERRRRNKLASRRLRQKHLDHVSELQSRLEVVMQERDELRLRAAKWEGEVMVLRNLLGNRTHDRS